MFLIIFDIVFIDLFGFYGIRFMIYYFMICIFNLYKLSFTFSSNNLYLLSFSSISFAANSLEREIYDLFGVCFTGNNMLTRMFSD